MKRLTKQYSNGTATLDAVQFPPITQETIDREINAFKPFRAVVERLAELEEKQTPKVPNYEGDGYDGNGKIVYDTAYCPNCEHEFEVDYDTPDYCPNCGQALDWSGEDGK